MARREIFDVCVIGTGAGGGVMIQQLCAAGLSVVALERGRALNTSHFISDDELSVVIRDELFSPGQLETWRPDENTPTETGRFNMLAYCVGGTITHWAGWAWRFRPDDFKVLSTEGALAGANLADWPFTYEELAPYYDQAEREFGVAGKAGANPFGSPQTQEYPNPPHPDRRMGKIFTRGAEKLGLHPFPVPMAINPRPYGGRPACMYGGACQQYGCHIGAKATTFSVSLPRALATGRLDLRARARATEITLEEDGLARSVRYLDAAGAEQEVFARQFVVAGGPVGTAHLLLTSKSSSFPRGLANSSDQVGRNLTLHTGPSVSFVVDEPARGFTGLETHTGLDDWHASDARRGFIRGGVVADFNMTTKQPIMYATLGSDGNAEAKRGWGADYKSFLRDFPRTVGMIGILEDLPMESNRIDLDPHVNDTQGMPAVRITHRQHPNDVAMARWYEERMLDLADAAGAQKKWAIRALSGIDEPGRGGAHIHGTCRMGEDPERSVVDRWCRSHDVKNLWVVDGSVFPTSGGYNPTLTILANAYRVADHFIAEGKKQSL